MAARNVGEFGKSSVIHQTKTSKLVLIINNLLADQLICQIFFCQMLKTSQFAKLSPYTVRENLPSRHLYTRRIKLLQEIHSA